MNNAEAHLEKHGVKPTAVRIIVWKEVSGLTQTFTLSDLEERMPSMDRSSIFRALRLFTEHHLLHEINDGSGLQKYCVCRCTDEGHISHIHFSCLRCGHTFCLADYQIPVITLPEGFEMHDAEYVVRGVCRECAKKP